MGAFKQPKKVPSFQIQKLCHEVYFFHSLHTPARLINFLLAIGMKPDDLTHEFFFIYGKQ